MRFGSVAIALVLAVVSEPELAHGDWRSFGSRDGLASDRVESILEDRDQDLWVTFGPLAVGVSRYDGLNWRTFTTADGLASDVVASSYLDRAGAVWFGTAGGLSRHDGSGWRTFTTADGLGADDATPTIEDRAGHLWAINGTPYGWIRGVSRFDGRSWTSFTIADGLASNAVRTIVEDPSGTLWVGSDGGLSRFDGRTWTSYTVSNGLADSTVARVLADRSGAIWISYPRRYGGIDPGVSRFDGSGWRTFTTSDGLAGNAVFDIVQDRSGVLWFSTDGGISRFDGIRWSTFPFDTTGVYSYARISEAPNGALWFVGFDRFGRNDERGWSVFTSDGGLKFNYIEEALHSSRGSLWLRRRILPPGAYSPTPIGEGVGCFDGLRWRKYSTADGLASNDVADFLEDSNGNMWFATHGGVSRFDGVEWKTYGLDDGFARADVHAIAEDARDHLCLATGPRDAHPGGLTRFDGWTWKTSTRDDGLPSSNAFALAEDDDGRLWIGTGPEPGSASDGPGAPPGRLNHYDGIGWRTYSTRYGLAADGVTSMLEDHDGNLWFGTTNGVSRLAGSQWSTFRTTDGLRDSAVRMMLEGADGRLWFVTLHGIACFDGVRLIDRSDSLSACTQSIIQLVEGDSARLWVVSGSDSHFQISHLCSFDGVQWREATKGDGLVDSNVRRLFKTRGGTLWCASDTAVARYENGRWYSYGLAFPSPSGSSTGSVIEIFEDHSGALWFFTTAGVARLEGADWRMFTTEDGLTNYGTTAVAEDGSGRLWMGTHRGLSRFDGSRWTTIGAEIGLANQHVTSIHVDREGRVWIGTSGAGLGRFDGSQWRSFGTGDGLAGVTVTLIHEDRSGNIWVGTPRGISRFDGTSWTTFTEMDGASLGSRQTVLEDRSGHLWLIAGDEPATAGGVSRFDGKSFATYTRLDGLGDDAIHSILVDRAGSLWFAGCSGVTQYDGATWRRFRPGPSTSTPGTRPFDVPDVDTPCSFPGAAVIEDRTGNVWYAASGSVTRRSGSTQRTFGNADGLTSPATSLAEDRAGNVLCGTLGGAFRYDGLRWTRFLEDAVDSVSVNCIHIDRAGVVWLGTARGAVRYDGSGWQKFGIADGLVDNRVQAIHEDRTGALWFGTATGLSVLDPDRVPPGTVIVSGPPRIMVSRDPAVAFAASIDERRGIEFSYSFEGGPWSGWSSIGAWSTRGLPDGAYTFEVRARDAWGNEDRSPARITFEIDASPPATNLTSPAFAQVLRDSIDIRGTAADPRFREYDVRVRRLGATSWSPPDADSLAHSTVPVVDGVLAGWNTARVPDGSYEVRLTVSDTLGLSGTALATATVDNHAPFVSQTTPVRVTAAGGGDVFTTNGEMHLYFPPHGFAKDAVVTITEAVGPPDTLDSGAIRIGPQFDIEWRGSELVKTASLEIGYAAGDSASSSVIAIHRRDAQGTWHRIGGTVDRATRRIAAPVRAEGRFAVFVESTSVGGPSTLSELTLMPRIFSPRGTFASREIAIAFALGRAASVTVKIYSRSGRLVRVVAEKEPLGAGANVLRWDGIDRDGASAGDGIYLVTVEALGETRTGTLAVVR